jgi:site-specific recombinase XerD
MSVYEKNPGSGVWYISYADGRDAKGNSKITRKKVGNSKALAEKVLIKAQHEAMQRQHLPESVKPRDVFFSELMTDALVRCEESNGISAQRGLAGIVKALTPDFGNRIASTITTEELNEWLRPRKRLNSWRPATYNGYVVQLRLIFRGGIKAKKVRDNPAQFLDKMKLGYGKPRYLTTAEETALDTTVAERFPQHWDAYIFAKSTGLRATAQLDLTWAMVNFERREITLPAKANSKYLKDWPLPLSSAAWAIIERRKALAGDAARPDRFIFAEYHTDPAWKGVPAYWFPVIVAAAGIKDFTWHSLRHNFASQLVMRGADLSSVSRLMTHTNLRQTDLYADLSTDHLRVAASLMDAPVTPQPPSSSQGIKLVEKVTTPQLPRKVKRLVSC